MEIFYLLTHVNLLTFSYIFKGKSPYTLKHGKPDHEATDVSVQHCCCSYCLLLCKKQWKCTSFSLFPTIETNIRLPCAQAANLHAPIQYPKPDGHITFDVPTSLYRYACCKNEECLLSSPYLCLLTITLLFVGLEVPVNVLDVSRHCLELTLLRIDHTNLCHSRWYLRNWSLMKLFFN